MENKDGAVPVTYLSSSFMSIIIWNVNGAASWDFMRTVKGIIRTQNPDILELLETRVSGIKANFIYMKLGFTEWIRVEALGYSGGIWLL